MSADEILPSSHFWNMHFFPRSHCRSLFCSVFCALVIALWLQVSLFMVTIERKLRLQNATRCYKYSFFHAMFLFNVMTFRKTSKCRDMSCHISLPRHWSFSTTGTWTWRCTGTWTTSSMNSICGTLWRHSNRGSCVNRSIEASTLTIFLLIFDTLIPRMFTKDAISSCSYALKIKGAQAHNSIGVNRLHHV